MKISTGSFWKFYKNNRSRPLAVFNKSEDSEAGMTIIEILIVIALIGTIMTIIMTNILSKSDEAKIDLTTIQEKRIGENLDIYKLHVGRYPKTEDGLKALLEAPSDAKSWRGPYTESDKLEDAWGKEFSYENLGSNHYRITSAGPDTDLGSADDISYPAAKEADQAPKSFELSVGKAPEQDNKAQRTQAPAP